MASSLSDPTAQPDAITAQLSRRPESLRGMRLSLLKNGKRHSGELLEEVLKLIEPELEPAEVLRRTVPPTWLAPDDQLDELAGECDLVVEAVGD